MLVIGDLNVKDNLGYPVEVLHREYICEDRVEIDYYIKLFNLQPKHLVFNNNITLTYYKNSKTYSFYDSSNYVMLQKLYVNSAGSKFKPRYADKLMEWATCKTRVRFVHKDVYSWCNRIETYLLLSKELESYDGRTRAIIESLGNGLTSWSITNYGIDRKLHVSREFIEFKKEDLYKLVSLKKNSSVYLSILLNPYNYDNDTIVEIKFNKLSFDDKIQAFMEKLYVDTINDYVVPYIEDHKKMPDNIFELFLKTYMNTVSKYANYGFNHFGLHHYETILNYFDESVITYKFYSEVINGSIERVDGKKTIFKNRQRIDR